MARSTTRRMRSWLLEVEMGVVWGVAGLAIIVFVFLAIWFIDPALLTLALQFRQARCVAQDAAFLIGISNCSWTSCRLGCTREIYKCWQVQVTFEFVRGTEPYRPPWTSISEAFEEDGFGDYDGSEEANNLARLYPNVRGCGYPPQLNCEKFYNEFGNLERGEFDCWVSTTDTSIAMTTLDLEKSKREVIFSLIPLFTFIVFVLYAFCRLGVFSICNPLKLCPQASDNRLDMPNLTPKKLFDYKKSLLARKSQVLASFQAPSATSAIASMPVAGHPSSKPGSRQEIEIPATIDEGEENASSASATSSPSEKSTEVREPARRRKKRTGKHGDDEGESKGKPSDPDDIDRVMLSSTTGSIRRQGGTLSAASPLASPTASSPNLISPRLPVATSVRKEDVVVSRRDSLEQEMLDLDLLEDVGSVRSAWSVRASSRGAWVADAEKKDS